MTLKNRNHYVPCLYLKRWAGADAKVWVYRVLVPHASVPPWKPSSINGIGYHRNLYTRILAGAATDEFENWLERDFETLAAEPIRKATVGERLSSDDWECIIRFLAAQDVRTPARLMEFLTRQTEQLPGMTDEVLENVVSELAEVAQRRQSAGVARTQVSNLHYRKRPPICLRRAGRSFGGQDSPARGERSSVRV